MLITRSLITNPFEELHRKAAGLRELAAALPPGLKQFTRAGGFWVNRRCECFPVKLFYCAPEWIRPLRRIGNNAAGAARRNAAPVVVS